MKLLTIEGLKISVWLQNPTVPAGGSWSLQNVIDIEDKVQSVCPDTPHNGGKAVIDFVAAKRSGDVVVLQVYMKYRSCGLIVLDLQTKEMHVHKWGFSFVEINL